MRFCSADHARTRLLPQVAQCDNNDPRQQFGKVQHPGVFGPGSPAGCGPGQVTPTPSRVLGRISPILPPFFPVFCAFSPSRRGGSNEPQAGTQGQETAGEPPRGVFDSGPQRLWEESPGAGS